MASVYLADRDLGYRKALAHALRQRGADVEEFDNGSELYARAVASDPDLIVMETDLDEMDGFQVFARLSRKRPGRPYRVVFVTEFEHPRVARVCRERGALAYFGKNRPQEEVASALVSLLPEGDPLERRQLPAALAWLQSRGKSGRLDVRHGARQGDLGGYVLLHNGRILEAQWQGRTLAADQVSTLFSESLADARFRFVEAPDALGLPLPPAEPPGAPEWSSAAADSSGAEMARGSTDDAPAAAAATFPPKAAGAPEESRSPAVAPARGAVAGAPFAPSGVPPLPAPERGSLAAVRELRAGNRSRTRRVARRVAAVTVALAVVLATGLALAASYPGYLPAGLAQVLSSLGVRRGQLPEVEQPVSPLATAPEEEPDAYGATGSSLQPASTIGAGGEERGSATSAGASDSAPSVPTVTGSGEGGTGSDPAEDAVAGAPARDPEGSSVASATPPRRAPPRPAPVSRAAPDAEDRAGIGGAASARERAAPAAGPPRSAPARQPAETVQPRELSPAAADLVQRPVLLQRESDLYYPPELKSQGVGGSVLLNIRVGTNGRAQQVEIRKSSGYEAFDQAAVAAVGTFLWEPGRDEDGPAEAWITQAVTFRP